MDKNGKIDEKSYRPEWVTEGEEDTFATVVRRGVERPENGGFDSRPGKKGEPSVDELTEGVRKNNKTLLARAITLVESNSPSRYSKGREILKKIGPEPGESLRIGITGPPGAGKSTIIEEIGLKLVSLGHKVAILAVDPSSILTGGSILGDKTRMERLSRVDECFIRPSPSGGTLGGVTRKSRETILLCEAAGYDIILLETVGVGQSEVTVRSMVDLFTLILNPGSGDELQGIKRGVMELADLIVVNKADGNNLKKAEITKSEYSRAVHYLLPSTEGWDREVITASAIESKGIKKIVEIAENFRTNTIKSGIFRSRRREQAFSWAISLVENFLKDDFYSKNSVRDSMEDIKGKIINGEMLPTEGAEKLIRSYFKS
ncbi:MAG: methylmalonyl Co-A mutase-associated GTPase MeaB [Acidobacteriota bacterium]